MEKPPDASGATSLACNSFRPWRGSGAVAGADFPTACEPVKKYTISRKGAKAQRFGINNCFVFLSPSAALRLCAIRFCSPRNYFTASCAVGYDLSPLR